MSAPVSVSMAGRCKSSSGERHAPVTESNCVTMRWGGKQLEVNEQSVG